jgi:hypothetical protein
MNFTIKAESLATMSSEEFDLFAMRLAILQGVTSKPQVQTPPERKLQEGKGENELRYLATRWRDNDGKEFSESRLTIGCVTKDKFAEMGLTTREEIALACLNAGKVAGEYFREDKSKPTINLDYDGDEEEGFKIL